MSHYQSHPPTQNVDLINPSYSLTVVNSHLSCAFRINGSKFFCIEVFYLTHQKFHPPVRNDPGLGPDIGQRDYKYS